MSALAPVLQAFFTDRLLRERHASPQTVAAYRDTWRLLLGFGAKRIGKLPSALDLEDFGVPLICAFLDHLEHDRGNSVRTRNARLAAIHSLFRYAAPRHPEHAATIARVLAILPKRFERALVAFLTEAEVETLLAVPDRTSWTGRRDHALLLVAVQTGLRISELIGLRRSDVHLGSGAHLVCHGKGRKCSVKHLRPYVFAKLMLRRRRAGQIQGQRPPKRRQHNFCPTNRHSVFRKPMSPGSRCQDFVIATSVGRSQCASAFAFISRSTSA